MALKKYVLFLNGKKIYTKKLKEADQGATFHHTIERDFVPDGIPKEEITAFDVKVGEAPPPVNIPPFINLKSSVNVLVDSSVTIAATITDSDGSISNIEWKQISLEPQVQFTTSEDKKSISFTALPDPAVYIFEVTATDDDGAFTSKQVTVTATIEVPPEPTADLVIGVAGDTDTGNEADTIFGRIAAEKADVYAFTGDTSYDDNDGTGWTDLIDKNGLKEEIILTQGNHEHAEENAEACQADIEQWMPSLKDTPEVNPNEQSWEKTSWLTAKQVKNSYIISLNTQDTDRNFQRNQYNWAVKQLDIAKGLKDEGKVDWIIVLVHKAWYTLKSNHAPEVAMRSIYQPLFEQHQVDFVLQGHNHNLQNWLPLTTNAVQLFTKLPSGEFDFAQPHGQFYLVSGAGGHDHHSINEDPAQNPNVFFANYNDYGYHVIYIAGKNATVQTKDIDGKVLNEFKVTKGPIVIVTPPECPEGTHWDVIQQKCVPDIIPPPPPPDGEVDAFGMKMLYKTTGKKVAMERGTDHRNGQRYNVNHKFENHLMQGYYLLGEGQDKIETKEDGPNHGSCDFTTDQICFWWEAGVDLASGKAESQYEWPHADNYSIPDEKNTVLESVGPLKAGNWCGWATCCYWGPDGLRHYKAWCDPNPFPNNDPTQKPLNNWKLVIHLIHTADLITKPIPITIPRDMSKVMNYDQGFECEIRMNNGTNHDTDMKNAWVFEIEKPTS